MYGGKTGNLDLETYIGGDTNRSLCKLRLTLPGYTLRHYSMGYEMFTAVKKPNRHKRTQSTVPIT